MTGRPSTLRDRLPDLAGAACVGHDATLWDERVDGEHVAEAALRRSIARAICIDCPIRDACRVARDDSAGVWAGEVWLTRANGRVTRARYGEPEPEPPPEKRARPVRISDTKERQVRELHGQGYTSRHIAEAVGISQPTVSRVLRDGRGAS